MFGRSRVLQRRAQVADQGDTHRRVTARGQAPHGPAGWGGHLGHRAGCFGCLLALRCSL